MARCNQIKSSHPRHHHHHQVTPPHPAPRSRTHPHCEPLLRPLSASHCRDSGFRPCENSATFCGKNRRQVVVEGKKLTAANTGVNVRANAVKLLFCLTEDGDEATISEHVGQKSIETLIRIIRTSNDEEEIASSLGIISNLPQTVQITEWLLSAGGLQIVISHVLYEKPSSLHKSQLVENATGALCRFTDPRNQQSQKKAAEAGIIPKLVQLVESGTSLTKRRAAISLAQFCESSLVLSQPIPKRKSFWCFSAPPKGGCPVHQGICTVESSFCLVEAGAVVPLARLLEDPDHGACEAALDALLTFIVGERLQTGSKVLAEANALLPMIKLLAIPSPKLQEKVLMSLERIFQLVEFRQKYGPAAQMPLVDLTQRGNSGMKSLAAKVRVYDACDITDDLTCKNLESLQTDPMWHSRRLSSSSRICAMMFPSAPCPEFFKIASTTSNTSDSAMILRQPR
ncbi:hypothetical protein RJ640_008895 [Escallonia rubra]|uniref:Uncharacterized protein n=1 Tax=Escallonia rubra TaxID=112253 RepID=A0AA88U5N9_9ASTE|nr:hypothetical protein RJ640_008895 [Escallonia rubra]